jgi:hypothetical protein
VKVNVVNKYRRRPAVNDVYIGRGSPLGNPFPITLQEPRDVVCDKYEQHICTLTECMDTQINTIIKVGKQFGSVNLVCFCKPQRCHGETIKRVVEERVANGSN